MTPLTPAAVTALAQQAAESPAHLDPVLVQQVCQEWEEQREALTLQGMGKQLTLLQQQRDAALAERDNLCSALATAQAERSEALMECNCAVLERDAAILRAEQAEAALAQAQAERDSLIKRLDFWIECNNSERANGRMPTFLNPYTILLWIGDKRAAAEADAAQQRQRHQRRVLTPDREGR